MSPGAWVRILVVASLLTAWPAASQDGKPPRPQTGVLAILDRARAELAASRSGPARALALQALEQARALDDRAGQAAAFSLLGQLDYTAAQPQKALDSLQRAIELHRELGDRAAAAETLKGLGAVCWQLERRDEAIRHSVEVLTLFRELRDRLGEAGILLNLGTFYLETGRPDEALRHYQQSLVLFEELRDPANAALAHRHLGLVYQGFGETAKALDHYEKAHARQREAGDRAAAAVTLTDLGQLYDQVGQRPKALAAYQEALPLLREAGNRRTEAVLLNHLGLHYHRTGQPALAVERLEESLRVARAIPNRRSEASALNTLGVVHSQSGRPEQALQCLEQALVIRRAVDDRNGIAATLVNLGALCDHTGQLREARAYYEQALPMFQALRDRRREAVTLNNLAGIVFRLGQPQKALERLEQARLIFRAAQDRANEANTLDSTAAMYGNLGQPEKAREFYDEALRIYREIGDSMGQADVLLGLGTSCRKAGEARQALEHLEAARSLAQQAGVRPYQASALYGLGVVHLDQGRAREALQQFEAALALRKDARDRAGEAEALGGVGAALSALGEREMARHCADQALAIHRELGNRNGEALLLQELSVRDLEVGRDDVARPLLEQAIALQEGFRAALGGPPEARLAYNRAHLGLYQAHTELLLRAGENRSAFAAVQQLKARVLADLMEGGKVDLAQHLTAEELKEQRRLRLRLSGLEQQLARETVRPTPDPARRAALVADLRQATGEWDRLMDRLYARHPSLAEKQAARAAGLAEVASALPADTALLEYVVLIVQVGKRRLVDRTVLFCVTSEAGAPRLRIYPIEQPERALAALVDTLSEAIARRKATYRQPARALYQALLAPAAGQLAGKKRLVICPDGPLWNLPFQALLAGRVQGSESNSNSNSSSNSKTRELPSSTTGSSSSLNPQEERFLIEAYEVVYAYSATHAKAALEASNRPGRAKPSGELLALADPELGDLATPGAGSPPGTVARSGGLPALAGARAEAALLRRLFPGARVYTGPQAQEALLKREAAKYRLLHLATHGVVYDPHPLLSNLVLAQRPREGEEDGLLNVREIFDLNLDAELVVLSACESGRGALHPGEGIVGLLWALFAAGSPTQVVSQWRVEDTSTAKLMEGFYRRLKTGRGRRKGAALRAAALALMRDGNHHHPFYWAPFILVGDWR